MRWTLAAWTCFTQARSGAALATKDRHHWLPELLDLVIEPQDEQEIT
jgi:hypothetical protein